jgi:molybdate transport system substrate-binding protein
MQETGTLAEGSVTSLGTTSIGVAVREDAPVPDISTPQAFKALLLSARTISVSDVAVGGTAAVYLPKLFERMEIAAALEPKLVRCSGGGDVTERVARGEAEIGITFVSEMLPIAGVAVIGKLPEPYGNDTTYCAGVTAKSRVGGEAAAFVAALADPVMASVWQRAGFELSKRP